MSRMTRQAWLRALAVAGGVLAAGFAAACGRTKSADMMAGMMGSATAADMSAYADLFARHTEIRRTVRYVPGGVRTVTESDAPDLVALLQAHVASMYDHLAQGTEVECMSESLPTLFRHAHGYRRRRTITAKGVVVTETSRDPRVTQAIREHASEVSGFVRDGMPAMMR
jgi:hypothetical protein